MPAVLNAANEIAVHAFLDKKIGFTDIPLLIEATMRLHDIVPDPDLKSILLADTWARTEALKIVLEKAKNKG